MMIPMITPAADAPRPPSAEGRGSSSNDGPFFVGVGVTTIVGVGVAVAVGRCVGEGVAVSVADAFFGVRVGRMAVAVLPRKDGVGVAVAVAGITVGVAEDVGVAVGSGCALIVNWPSKRSTRIS